ncbi:hypothetical protein GALL_526800 [mine drainage metagenome]|uniref:Uncharacterized protein n=1 Tax=mine drainage metagenome TaxID=410659 RepID=A0A1J5P3L7_9ZZZZ
MARLAHRHRDRKRFGFGIFRFDHGEVCHAERNLPGDVGLGQSPLPLRGRV